ncbi:unnamed protein product [Sphenostylis stenocarpa]|uniref:UDP-N-acetylglucosamine transferase subunit ALG14 n=2 Tax=Phaseoleae TaxID=163735 RepID=A0AA86RW87_9FABA|nr:unnamed protein product [Sphenostylis stenocarpa]
MSTRRSRSRQSGASAEITDAQITDLVSKLQQLIPELRARRSDKVSAAKVLQETCNYIKNLHREVDDLSDRLSELLANTDSNSAQAAIIRSLLMVWFVLSRHQRQGLPSDPFLCGPVGRVKVEADSGYNMYHLHAICGGERLFYNVSRPQKQKATSTFELRDMVDVTCPIERNCNSSEEEIPMYVLLASLSSFPALVRSVSEKENSFLIYLKLPQHSGRPLSKRAPKPVSTLIILGSGGHTAEMLNLLAVLQKERFNPRFYIAAATDNMSLQKAQLLESALAAENASRVTDTAQFMKIYRSREVGQSYITSVWTTLIAMVHALWLMIKIRPEVILCNGPGTCIPLCAIAFIFKVLGIRWSSIFYVESIARVRRLSLSGLLLYKLRMADQLFVQWPQLQRQYPLATYVEPRYLEFGDAVRLN